MRDVRRVNTLVITVALLVSAAAAWDVARQWIAMRTAERLAAADAHKLAELSASFAKVKAGTENFMIGIEARLAKIEQSNAGAVSALVAGAGPRRQGGIR